MSYEEIDEEVVLELISQIFSHFDEELIVS